MLNIVQSHVGGKKVCSVRDNTGTAASLSPLAGPVVFLKTILNCAP